MRIILNADDFGWCEDTVRATVECFERGALTSASIMPNMPATAAAIEYARQHPEFSFGAHLTFVGDGLEQPVSAPEQVPHLASPDGLLLPSNQVRLTALQNRIPVGEIEQEATAQLAVLRDAGLAISHVDSHGHLHKFRPFREALARVLPSFGIRRVRAIQDIYIRRPLLSPTYWLGPLWGKRLRRMFVTTDHFFMPASAVDTDWVGPFLRRSLAGTIEIGLHPGFGQEWRNRERLAAQSFAKAVVQHRHELASWNDIP